MTVPDELPPDTLQKRDIVVGKGPVAKKGDTVSMQYVGLTWSTSVEFDASWDRGQPYTFKLGEGNVIAGWDQGIPGMRKGGAARADDPGRAGVRRAGLAARHRAERVPALHRRPREAEEGG